MALLRDCSGACILSCEDASVRLFESTEDVTMAGLAAAGGKDSDSLAGWRA